MGITVMEAQNKKPSYRNDLTCMVAFLAIAESLFQTRSKIISWRFLIAASSSSYSSYAGISG